MAKIIDLVGHKYGLLTVLSKSDKVGRYTYWLCQCECGAFKEVPTNNLRSNSTRSCGCLHRNSPTRIQPTHGKSRTSIYTRWDSMMQRCTNPSAYAYKNYGARGIKVCERWHTFENFLADMGEPPEGMTLDRINNNGDYTPENCRWATVLQQTRNQRTNRLISYQGKTQCLTAWAEDTGIKAMVIGRRLRAGWTVEAVLTTPVAKRTPRKRR